MSKDTRTTCQTVADDWMKIDLQNVSAADEVKVVRIESNEDAFNVQS